MFVFVAIAVACESWSTTTTLQPLPLPSIDESSGLAASRTVPGLLWTHDDDGDAVIVSLATDGETSSFPVPSASLEDWEAIAAAPCPRNGECLYIGDIGSDRDNPSLQVYIVDEPELPGDARLRAVWNLTWPGVTHDAETLLIHPCTGAAWILTRDDDLTEVFGISDRRGVRETDLIPLDTLGVGPITDGAFAPDGTAVVLRSSRRAYRVPVVDGEPVWSQIVEVRDQLDDGEGVAWLTDGSLWFTSEGSPTPLQRMSCEQPVEMNICSPVRTCGCAHPNYALQSYEIRMSWAFVAGWFGLLTGLRRRTL